MFSFERMPKRILVIATLVAFCTLPAVAKSNIVTGPVDRAGFQAVIDAADEGDVIVCLGGIYDFSDQGSVVIDKGLTIRADDENDPPLFVGDTVDGTVNGLPVIGTPERTGNNAFQLPLDGVIDGLRIEGLHFTGFDRTLSLRVGIDYVAPGCPEFPGADFTNLVIARNNIRQTRRGIQVFGGPLRDFSIKDNTIEAVGNSIGIFLIGGTRLGGGGCPFVDSEERLEDGEIKNNTISARNALFAFGVVNDQIKSNSISAGSIGIYVGDDRALFDVDDGPIDLGSVKDNVVTAGFVGIVADGPTTTEGEIKGNTLTSSVVDVYLELGANGFTVKENTFLGTPAFANVYLEPAFGPYPATHDNLVIVGPSDTVIDDGINNEVIVE